MGHIHPVTDTDNKHFIIDPITRAIKNETSKLVLIKNDHNSEEYTFEIPRFVEGHDMSLSTKVEVHFINISSKSREKSSGVYEVKDIELDSENNTINFSWLVSRACTEYAGSLTFAIRFACLTGDVVDYAWHTGIYSGITVSDGISNPEVELEDYIDLLQSWYDKIISMSDDLYAVTDEGVILNISEKMKALEISNEDLKAKYDEVNEEVKAKYDEVKEEIDTRAFTNLYSNLVDLGYEEKIIHVYDILKLMTDKSVAILESNATQDPQLIDGGPNTDGVLYISKINNKNIIFWWQQLLTDGGFIYNGSCKYDSSKDEFSDITWKSFKNCEVLDNKVTTISETSTDVEYPSALCVYNSIKETKESAISEAVNKALSKTKELRRLQNYPNGSTKSWSYNTRNEFLIIPIVGYFESNGSTFLIDMMINSSRLLLGVTVYDTETKLYEVTKIDTLYNPLAFSQDTNPYVFKHVRYDIQLQMYGGSSDGPALKIRATPVIFSLGTKGTGNSPVLLKNTDSTPVPFSDQIDAEITIYNVYQVI